MRRPEIRVAVTGFGGLETPEAGAAVARALRHGWGSGITIDAFGYDALMTGAWMPGIADWLHVIPAPTAGDSAMLERILEIASERRLDAIIPCLESDIAAFSRLAGPLDDAGIRTLVARPDRVDALRKCNLSKVLHENDILSPKSIHVPVPSDVPLYADQLGYPLLVKGAIAGTRIVRSARQAQSEAEALYARWGSGVVLQQFIYGDSYSVAMVAGQDGSCRGAVTMRKLAVDQSGQEVCGSVVDDPQITGLARGILDRMDWRGPIELEFVRTSDSTQPFLRDINCRFPSWIMLSHWAKHNLPLLLLKEMLGQREPRVEHAQPGTLFIRSVEETAVPLSDLLCLKRQSSVAAPKKRGYLPQRQDPNEVARIGSKIAVTGISTFDMINPGLGVVRALRQAPNIAKIYGLNYGTFDSGAFQSDLFDAAFRLPITNEPKVLFERIREIHESHPFDLILPCLDGELPLFIALREEIEELGVRTLLPTRDAFEKRSKLRLFGGGIELSGIDFDIPESFVARTEEGVVDAIESVGLPAVVKGPLWGCLRVESLEEAREAWRSLESDSGGQVVVQPVISGDNFAVAVVCGRDHRAISRLTIKKLSLCERGSTWSAVHVPQPELEESFSRFLEKLQWVGPAEAEFIRDDMNDRFYLIEVNPRFTGWISYSGSLGSNHPLNAVKAAFGDEFEPQEDLTDLVFMRSSNEVAVQTSDLASLSLKGFVQNG